jgi:hypothetical protein
MAKEEFADNVAVVFMAIGAVFVVLPSLIFKFVKFLGE